MTFDVYKKRTTIHTSIEKLFFWHARNGAISRLTPPWAPLKMIDRKGHGIDKGVKVIFEIRMFGIPMIWEAEHFEYKENKVFKDRQLRGPFSKWVHTHRFIPDGENATIMEDNVEFRLPMGFLSRPFYGFAKKNLNVCFITGTGF